MSSFKNAVRSKTHKERSQPAAREKLGALEKHKDYVLRAKDFHSKEARLKLLRQKAMERNPDEFYFKMIKSKTKNGIHELIRENNLSHDVVKLLKSQDLNYIHMKKQTEQNKILRLKESLHLLGNDGGSSRHRVFVDEDEDMESFDPVKYFDTPEELINEASLRPKISDLEKSGLDKLDKKQLAKLNKQRKSAYKELVQRITRKDKLTNVETQLQTHKNLMSKGRCTKIVGPDGKKSFKWKAERKK